MFGGLSKLFSRTAANHGDDVLARLATNYGDDVARATSGTLTNLLPEVATKEAATKSSSRLGDNLVRASNTALNAPLALGKKDMRELGPDAYEKIGKLFDRTGLSKLDDLKELAKNLTGSGENAYLDEVTDAVRTNLGKGNIVDLNDIAPELREIRDSMSPISARMFDEADPIKKAKILKQMANDINTSATESAEKTLKRDHFNKLGNLIDERIDANIDPKYMSQAYDDVANEFLHRSQVEMRKGNKQFSEAYKRLAKEYADTPVEDRIMGNFRGSKKDFVDLSKIVKKNDQTKGGGSFSRAVREFPVIGRATDALISEPVERATQKAGEVMRKTGRAFQTGKAQNTLKKGTLIGGGIGALSLLGGGGNNNNNGLPTVQSVGSAMKSDTETPDGNKTMKEMTQSQQELTVGGYSRDQLENAYVAALMDNNANAAKALGTMIDMLDNKETRADKRAATNAGKKNKKGGDMETAMSQLNSMLGNYEAQGVAGGTLTNLLNSATGGAYNPKIAAYNDQSQSVGISLLKALGESGALSESDMARAKALIPTNTDSPAKAQAKLQTLRSMLNSVAAE